MAEIVSERIGQSTKICVKEDSDLALHQRDRDTYEWVHLIRSSTRIYVVFLAFHINGTQYLSLEHIQLSTVCSSKSTVIIAEYTRCKLSSVCILLITSPSTFVSTYHRNRIFVYHVGSIYDTLSHSHSLPLCTILTPKVVAH